jgi:hypothetical protein
MKKIIATENGKITIRGNGTWIPVEYKQADWSNGEEVPYFEYKDEPVFLDEMTVTDPRSVFSEYDGVLGFNYWSGLLIKLSKFGDAVQVYYFYC